MVLPDESQPADMSPPATMEDAAIAAEERYYGNLSSTAAAKPSGFDSDTGNHKVSKLNYSDAARRIGPNALLRVMSGDRVSISVDAFYPSAGQDNSNNSVVADVVASLVSAFGGGSSTAMDPTGHYTIGDRNITSFNTTSYPTINRALKSDDPNMDNGKPKAYVSWILFDEQFNMVRSSSATRQVDMAADTRQQMAYTDIAMHSNGYLYVYLSNESPAYDPYCPLPSTAPNTMPPFSSPRPLKNNNPAGRSVLNDLPFTIGSGIRSLFAATITSWPFFSRTLIRSTSISVNFSLERVNAAKARMQKTVSEMTA